MLEQLYLHAGGRAVAAQGGYFQMADSNMSKKGRQADFEKGMYVEEESI